MPHSRYVLMSGCLVSRCFEDYSVYFIEEETSVTLIEIIIFIIIIFPILFLIMKLEFSPLNMRMTFKSYSVNQLCNASVCHNVSKNVSPVMHDIYNFS